MTVSHFDIVLRETMRMIAGKFGHGTDIKGPVPENKIVPAKSKIAELCECLGIDAELRGNSVNYLDDMEKILQFLLQREVDRSK